MVSAIPKVALAMVCPHRYTSNGFYMPKPGIDMPKNSTKYIPNIQFEAKDVFLTFLSGTKET